MPTAHLPWLTDLRWFSRLSGPATPAFSLDFPLITMQLHLSTWPEIERYLDRSTGIIIPIGSTEQHGPTGLIGTDSLCADAIARGVGDRCNALVAPPIAVGMALHHMAFPGSMSLRPSTLIRVIQDLIVGLSRSGFRRFFLINGHGGNMATVKAAFSETYAYLADLPIEGADKVQCQLANWFMCGSVLRLARDLYGDQEGAHATPSEVALTQYLHPETIRHLPLDPNVAQGHRIYGATDFRNRYPDGRMGSNPALATPEAGERFYQAAIAELSQQYQAFVGQAEG